MSSNYSSSDYWNDRYLNEKDAPYDWLFSYADVRDVMEYLIPNKSTKILTIGCGNAPFSPDMYREGGYTQMVNTDLSDVVIKLQSEFFPEQTWKVMDAMNLDVADKSFPVIIDKSLIDTLLCASRSQEKTVAMVKEQFRVLEPGGRFITFSLHTPDEVIPTYRDIGLDWRVSSFQIKSDRWNDTTNRKRSVAHTLIVCDKMASDGTYPHEHPLHIPKGVLAEDDYKRLKERANQVNLHYALEHAPMEFLRSALFHALHGESAVRNAKLRALRLLYDNHVTVVDPDASGDDLSTTPVFDEKEVLERCDHSLDDYLSEAHIDFQTALLEVTESLHKKKSAEQELSRSPDLVNAIF